MVFHLNTYGPNKFVGIMPLAMLPYHSMEVTLHHTNTRNFFTRPADVNPHNPASKHTRKCIILGLNLIRLTFHNCGWRQQLLQKRWYLNTNQNGVTSHNIGFFINTSVRTSNLTFKNPTNEN